jgi:hypothetical protein
MLHRTKYESICRAAYSSDISFQIYFPQVADESPCGNDVKIVDEII